MTVHFDVAWIRLLCFLPSASRQRERKMFTPPGHVTDPYTGCLKVQLWQTIQSIQQLWGRSEKQKSPSCWGFPNVSMIAKWLYQVKCKQKKSIVSWKLICKIAFHNSYIQKNYPQASYIWMIEIGVIYTVCPGSSDPTEKDLIYFHQKTRFTPFINYYDTLGWILFVYRAKYF